MAPWFPRVFSSSSQILSLLNRRTLLFSAQRLIVVLLTLSLIFPPSVFAGSFSLREGLHVSLLWEQIKAAVTSSEPASLDPLERPKPTVEPVIKTKNKEELKSKVSKLESSLPSKIELQTREKMNFFAVPVDNKKKALHGLEVEYQSTNPEVVFINKQGQATGGKPGTAEVIVSAGAQQLRYQVTVVPPAKAPKKTTQKIGSNSGRAKIYKGTYSFANTRKIARTYANRNYAKIMSAAVQGGSAPPPNYAPYAVGKPPLKTEPGSPNPPAAMVGTERPGSANYSFNVPLFSVPGRGPDAALDLFYNSRLWNNNGIAYFFDQDKNWLASGFSLGYGKMIFRELGVAGNGAGFLSINLITSDGTHHELYETGGTNSGIWETTDGTFIKFVEYAPNTWLRSYSSLGILIFPNGTRMEIGAGIQTYFNPPLPNYYRILEAFPTKITDRSGNYIIINYAGSAGPKIDTIVDSLNRYTRFYYNAQGNLFEITTPGYAGATERDAVRFFYQDLTIDPSFSNWNGSESPTPNPRKVIRYIFYPGTNTGYKYDYSTYGMIYKITQLRGMQLSGPVNDPNTTVSSEGQIAATTTYNYPTGPSNLSDIPKFTTRTDDWAGNTTGGPVVTTFSDNPSLGTSTVIAPDGTETITTKNGSGQVSQTEVKKNGVLYAKTVLEYNGTQITKVTTTNDKNQSKITEYGYTTYNNVNLVIEKDYAGVEVRRTETTYETGTGWIDRRLLHLPKTVLVKDASGTVVSRTEYTYDNSDMGVIWKQSCLTRR